jgi:colanic acid biosynthesis protein WcaH
MATFIPTPLYEQIVGLMPIPCVDIAVQDSRGRVLLVRRRNEPARGLWWFPGGRVHHGEQRCQAARRKLQEECGLEPNSLDEIGTYDAILPADTMASVAHHAITTLFRARVTGEDVVLDDQSAAACWLTPDAWMEGGLHPLVKEMMLAAVTRVELPAPEVSGEDTRD